MHPEIHPKTSPLLFIRKSIFTIIYLFFSRSPYAFFFLSCCLLLFVCLRLSVRPYSLCPLLSFCRLRSSLIVISSHSINGSHLLFKTKRGFIHVSTPPPSSLPSFLFPCQVAYLPCIFALKQKKNMREYISM